MAKTILVVDDERSIRTSLQGILEDEGYRPVLAEDGETALEMIQAELPDLVLLDIWMPGIDGIELLQKLKTAHPTLLIVMMSGHGTIETAVRATKLGAYDFIEKPLSLEKLVLTIHNAFELQRLQEENRLLRGEVLQDHEIVGDSLSIKNLREQIKLVAPSHASVLITGDNGVGKGIAALAIHAQSDRNNRAFMEINCASIPDGLIDLELFGHEKGAFPGAASLKKGKFELADGGTIFLDEISDMPDRTQAKVLRVLEEGRFERVGGARTIEVDVRVIAASNRKLDKEVALGTFREDLYYRLNVALFNVPPLRERKDDIPLLVDNFLSLFCRKEGGEKISILPSAVELMKCYEWPGNVRELKNIVERLVIMSSGKPITPDQLPDYISCLELSPEVSAGANSMREARETFEKEFIIQKLSEFGWDISRTADAIEVERANLHRKIMNYGIDLKK